MLIVVKPTFSCNAACAYCASRDQATHKGKMPARLAKRLVEMAPQFVEHSTPIPGSGNVTYLWHGGEPMLMGTAFFRTLGVATQQVTGKTGLNGRVRHTMQTNLTLWNSEWADLLRDFTGLRGVSSSMEPPDGFERRLAGRGDYLDTWMTSFVDARRGGFTIGLVCVVNSERARRPAETYYYFRNLAAGSHVRFNPQYPATQVPSGTTWDALTPEEYGEFLIKVWELWEKDGRSWAVEPIATWTRAAAGKKHTGSCNMSGRCPSGFLGVDPGGHVYHCGRAMDAEVLYYGQLGESSTLSDLDFGMAQKLHNRLQQLREGHCADCRWWELCHGGCPVQSHLCTGDMDKPSFWCKARTAFFERALGKTAPLGKSTTGVDWNDD